jgi:integrase
MAGNPYVIAGKNRGARLINLQKPWRRIRAKANLDDVRIHDLRHSFASVAAGTGMSLPMIGKLLGHSQPVTTARYAHLAADPIRAASNLIGTEINAAMQGPEGHPREQPVRRSKKPLPARRTKYC